MTASRRARAGWITLGAGAAILIAVLIGLSLWSWLARQSETQRQTHQRAAGRITLDLRIGEVRLVPGEAGRVDIERRLTWSGPKPALKEQWSGDTLGIQASCDEDLLIGACWVSYTIRVPAGTAVEARTAEGDITLRDLTGALRLTTETGAITGTGLRAADVEADAKLGNIALRFVQAPDSLRANSEAGNIDVEVPEGDDYALDIRGGLGEPEVGVRATAGAENNISVRNSTGGIRVAYLGS
ncbi:DUF4097 family beta strand repeat-containing protein [Nonomuraea angiospora]|uniref:DUF4097 family beta strand repeat-containing protein n=1 Tax=Nonomuraea angiospora TaxID=46172 RepID=UPI0029B18C4D|nr:DUF4097 family beta strand repeat-containing protein [Nonomuraea angiospora]MDX3100872.1 DUF4097 family beta strand repeat-containing protein [Nonomuraea angiospora]